jgi:SSS family transporter
VKAALLAIAALFCIAPAATEAETSSWIKLSPTTIDARIAKFLAGYPPGSAAAWNNHIIRLGAPDPNFPSATVMELDLNHNSNEIRLPDLPIATTFAKSTILGDTLYVFSNDNNLFALNLISNDQHWSTLPQLPAQIRHNSTIAAQDGQINIFGGTLTSGESTTEAWAYRSTPRDGTKITSWIRLQDVDASIAGSVAIPSGQTHILLLEIQTGTIAAYDTVTDSYANAGVSSFRSDCPIALALDSSWVLFDPTKIHAFQIEPLSVVRHLSVIDYTAIAVYFALFTGVGVFFARKQTSSENFALGGRNVKWWLAGISLYATGTSAISYMAIPALTYSSNILWWILPVPLAALALIPQAYLVIPLIRRLNLTSTYEYLERRFNCTLRLLASAQCIIFQVAGRMAVVILLPAMAISAVTGISLLAAVLVIGAVTTIYTAVGGIDAVIWTDAIQTILTIGGPLLALALVFFSFNHPAEVFTIDAKYSKFNLFLFDWNFTLPVFWIFIISTFFSVVGFAGDQTMVQRVLATPSDRAARGATLTLFVFVAIGATLFHFLGIVLFAYFHAHPQMLDPNMSNDQVVPLFIVQKMPIGVAGLLIASIFGASMSTLSGTINSVATLVVEDFYRRLRPRATDRRRLRLMKITSYAVGILATAIAAYLAMTNVRSMFETWSKLIALLGGGFVGVFTLGMFTRRANSAGAISGAIFSVLFTLLIRQYTQLHWTLYAPAAIGSCVIIGYATSLVFPAPVANLQGLTVYTAKTQQSLIPEPSLVTA